MILLGLFLKRFLKDKSQRSKSTQLVGPKNESQKLVGPFFGLVNRVNYINPNNFVRKSVVILNPHEKLQCAYNHLKYYGSVMINLK